MKGEARPRSICKFENKMAAYHYGQGRRKGNLNCRDFPSLQPQGRVGSYDVFALLDLGQRSYNVERQMDHNWRTLVNFSYF